MERIKTRRFGNIALEYSSFNKSWEIVQYYPNPFYGTESSYVFKNGSYYDPESPNYRISPECFNNKENKCVLAFIEQNGDLRTVGSRPFKLDSLERNIFLKLAKQAVYILEEKSDI